MECYFNRPCRRFDYGQYEYSTETASCIACVDVQPSSEQRKPCCSVPSFLTPRNTLKPRGTYLHYNHKKEKISTAVVCFCQ
jgi:hypothetical protein